MHPWAGPASCSIVRVVCFSDGHGRLTIELAHCTVFSSPACNGHCECEVTLRVREQGLPAASRRSEAKWAHQSQAYLLHCKQREGTGLMSSVLYMDSTFSGLDYSVQEWC